MRSGIQLCYPFEESRLAKWNTKVVLIQPKLDGERCRAVFDVVGNVTLYSSEQNIITSVPHINAQLESLELRNIELDGELYIHDKPIEHIHSIVGRTVNQHYNSESMQYHVFDMINSEIQLSRLTTVNTLFMKSMLPSVHIVPVRAVSSLDKIMECFHEFIDLGYEGFILRHPSALYVRKRSIFTMKFKPKKQDIYRIIGYKEEINKYGTPKGSLGSFICKGDDNTEFSVGSGFSANQRKQFWVDREDYIGKWCKVEYQNLTTKHVPRFNIFISVIANLPGGDI